MYVDSKKNHLTTRLVPVQAQNYRFVTVKYEEPKSIHTKRLKNYNELNQMIHNKMKVNDRSKTAYRDSFYKPSIEPDTNCHAGLEKEIASHVKMYSLINMESISQSA